MDRIKTLLKRLLLAIAALLAIVVLLGLLSRLTTPTAAQREVVALMERDELPEGPDAFGLLYTLGHDVPFDEIEAVVAADAATVAAWPDGWDTQEPEDNRETGQLFLDRFEWRRADYPFRFPSQADRELFCGYGDERSCLDRVRAAPEATAAAIARQEGLLERAEQMREYRVVRNVMPHMVAPLPPRFGMVPFTTARALTFVGGEEALAVRETCLDLAMLRRLATHTDIIAVAISGARHAGQQTARLLADMLSEWPLDRPLPDACTAALAPPVDEELLLCHAVRGEFRMMRKQIPIMHELAVRQGDWLDRVATAMLWDDESTVALAAEQLAPYCRTDRPGKPDHDWAIRNGLEPLLRWTCLGNPFGCTLTAIYNGGVFGDYADRMRDFGARLRLLGALAWMREEAAASGATADTLIRRLPAALSDAEHRIELSPDGRMLRAPLTWTPRGEWAEVPLPAALIPDPPR